MGVPALFRFLQREYPKIIVRAIEEQGSNDTDGLNGPPVVDITTPNPNGQEFDNLYLDMNAIVHPCAHPEGKPAPSTEENMMVEIFSHTNCIVNLVRPRKVLFMAIDGVPPCAKISQQRSRRFRSARDAENEAAALREAIAEWEAMGHSVSDDIKNKKSWDVNAITPGTPFMALLAISLRYWVAHKLNTDPGWKGMQVIISDASVPGEGEHKVMDWIRRQRVNPGYNPNTSHVIYGLDADLIILALATHEPYFCVLREDVFADSGKTGCHSCGRQDHQVSQCTNAMKYNLDGGNPKYTEPSKKRSFIFLDVTILREYLEIALHIPNQPFPFDLETAIDDWVFLIFLVGNDFLPHLPSIDIRKGGIDTLLEIWKKELPRMGGYVTNHGRLRLGRVQIILDGLARQEDNIFRKMHEDDERRKQYDGPAVKRTRPEENDDIKLWAPGYQERYYKSKFKNEWNDLAFRKKVTKHYVEGLCWVMHYYYQGTPSWQWYYPFHYAPFAGDFDAAKMVIQFRLGNPLKPFEQLMAVFPPASRKHIPAVYHPLMLDTSSPIKDFYPLDFQIDLNGKSQAWQGIVLLPFIDTERLLNAMAVHDSKLTQDEVRRNTLGNSSILISNEHPLFDSFSALYTMEHRREVASIDPDLSGGISGQILADANHVPGTTYTSPIAAANLPDTPNDKSLSVLYYFPKQLAPHKSVLLSGATKPSPTLDSSDVRFVQSGRLYNPSQWSHQGRDNSFANASAFGRGGLGGHGPQRGGGSYRGDGGYQGRSDAGQYGYNNGSSYGRGGGRRGGYSGYPQSYDAGGSWSPTYVPYGGRSLPATRGAAPPSHSGPSSRQQNLYGGFHSRK